jgi:hypothetical protein
VISASATTADRMRRPSRGQEQPRAGEAAH